MFKFLKEKIGNWAKKISKKEETVEKPKKEIKLPMKFEPGLQKYEPDLEKLKEETPEPGTESFFKKIKSKISKVKISEKDFEIYSEELKDLLLENNVAYEVTEKMIKELKEKIVGKEFLKKEIESEIKDLFKEIIEGILVEPYDLAKKIKEKKEKPYVILFCGINGTGKCVHGKSNIQLSNGNIIKAKNLYKKYSNKFQEENTEDGKIINIENENLLVPSFNPKTLQIENKKATHLWKLKKEDLMEIKLDNGNDFQIKVTPEHPFFVLRNGQVVKIRADEITEQDYISVPNKIEIQGKLVNLFNQIKNLDLFVYLSPEEAKEYILKKYNSIKEVHKQLKFKKNYCQFTQDIKNGKIPIEFIKKEEANFLKIKRYNDTKIITLPLFLTQEFAEFIGYVIGDGYINKGYIEITNQDPEIIKRIIELSKTLFNILPKVKKDTRSQNLYRIQLCSKTLVEIFKIFNLTPGKKGKNLKVPEQIILSNIETIKQFLRAYFDCDSYPSKNRHIELTSESHILIQQIDLLLRRFGILSTISKKIINEVPYWRLSILSKYSELFAERIGYLVKDKKNKVKQYHKIGLFQGCGKQDMIPLGKTLKTLRLELGFSIGEIQKYVGGYGIYEKKGIISKDKLKKLIVYYKLKKQGIFLKFLKDVSMNINIKEKYSNGLLEGVKFKLKNEKLIISNNKQILLTKKGQTYLDIISETNIISNKLLQTFDCLANSNICWISIKKINQIQNNEKFVYDLTVGDNHSFVANGFIVHNTTTIAKIADSLKKQKISSVIAAADTFRAASIEQIQEHGKKLGIKVISHEYGSDPASVGFDAIKYAKKNFIDCVLIDTAGRMHTSKNLIKEIEKISKVTKPDTKIFIGESITGNDVIEQARSFNFSIGIDGIILTKADIDEKGGTSLSVGYVTKKPILYLGCGQLYEDIVPFNKKDFIKKLGL